MSPLSPIAVAVAPLSPTVATLTPLSLVLALLLAIALSTYPMLRRRGPAPTLTFALLALALLLAPTLLSTDARLKRFAATLAAVWLLCKCHDLRHDRVLSFRAFVRFLLNPFFLVRQVLLRSSPPPTRPRATLLLASALQTLAATAALLALFHLDWTPFPFFLEHCAKVLTLYLALLGLLRLLETASTLLGATTQPLMLNPFASSTPADFWRRYNRPMGQFLTRHAFLPAGGFHSPLRATLAAFALSALLHEYVFALPVGRIPGYQSAFFLLQALAVAATRRLHPRGWRAHASRAATLLFNLLTSLLFFANFHAITPFYARPLPPFLQW